MTTISRSMGLKVQPVSVPSGSAKAAPIATLTKAERELSTKL